MASLPPPLQLSKFWIFKQMTLGLCKNVHQLVQETLKCPVLCRELGKREVIELFKPHVITALLNEQYLS